MDIALRAMSAEPEDRYGSAVAFQQAVRAYLSHWDSVALAQEAERLLGQAADGGGYDLYARALFAFEEAVALWDGNRSAAEGLGNTRRAYAEAAYAGGDYELALSVVGDSPAFEELRARIRSAQEDRRRRARAVRRLKVSVGSLAALLLVALTVGFFWVRAERDRADRARLTALHEGYYAKMRLAAVKVEERDYDDVEQLLRSAPAQFRGWEWGFLDRISHLDSMTLDDGAQVEALAVSPDGGTIASGDWQGRITLWDAATGRKRASVQAHAGVVTDLRFSRDGTLLASAGDDGTAALYDARSLERRALLQGHTDQVWSVALSPDGATAATGGMDGTLRLWDTSSGRELARVKAPTGGVTSVAFAPSGDLAYAYGDLEREGSVCLLKGGVWTPLLDVPASAKHITSLAFLRDGSALAVSSWDGTVALLDPATGRKTNVLRQDSPVLEAAFSPDGRRLATGSEDRTVRLWDVATGRCLAVYSGHSGAVGAVRFFPGGKSIVSGGLDGKIKVWAADGSAAQAVTLRSPGGTVAAVAFSPDGRLVASGGQDGAVRLWDAASDRPGAVLETDAGAVNALAFSPDCRLLAAACWDGAVVLYDTATMRPTRRLSGHEGVVRAVAFSPDAARLASAGWDGAVTLWDADSGRRSAVFRTGSPLQAVAFSPVGHLLAVGGRDKLVHVYDTASGKEVAALSGHAGWVRAVAFSPDESIDRLGWGRLHGHALGRAHAARHGDPERARQVGQGPGLLARRPPPCKRGRRGPGEGLGRGGPPGAARLAGARGSGLGAGLLAGRPHARVGRGGRAGQALDDTAVGRRKEALTMANIVICFRPNRVTFGKPIGTGGRRWGSHRRHWDSADVEK